MPEEIEEKMEESKPAEEQQPKDVEELSTSEGEELDEIAELKREIDELHQISEEYLDGWQRERAEFANYKKRMERERMQLQHNIVGDVMRQYLDIVDDLERALQTRPAEGEGASWAEGIELVYRKFLATLESEGVQPMQVEGQQFDPNWHEAISQEPNDEYESGQIIEVVRNGYLIGERVLRPATVRIAQ